MPTFLKLCQDLSRECGLSATSPSTTVGQNGEALRIVQWIQRANLDVQGAWVNWKFLWAQHSLTTVSGTRDYSAPSDLGEWDKTRFYIGDDPLHCVEYAEWDVKSTASGKPATVIIMPDNSLRLYPTPDDAYSITADYYKAPAEFSGNSDTGVVPEKFHDIILYIAITKYAHFEAAEEVLQYARTELSQRWPLLEASQLPGQYNMHNASISELTIIPE